MRLGAKWILPVGAPPIENGVIEVVGDTVVAVGRLSGVDRDLGEVVLLPGLINAHCHFDYTHFAGQVPFRDSFTDWIHDIVRLKAQQTTDNYRDGITAGIKLALQSGTTTVVNIECFPELAAEIPRTPLRIIWCSELIDLIHRQEIPDTSEGLSPHAPYTASAALYEQCVATRKLLTTHVAESVEEDEMFRQGRGSLYDACEKLGRPMTDCGHGDSPLKLLHAYGALGSRCLAVHANCVTGDDVRLLAATGTSVVHCPKTHRFFQRATPPLPALRHAGVNVCLGTDSLASNNTLDMFAEMRELASHFPDWQPAQILNLATINAARGINQSDRLGRIGVGTAADIIAVPLAGHTDPYAAVVFAEKSVTFMMINGKVVFG